MFRRIALALLAALLFSTAALAQTIPTSPFSGLPGSPDAGDLAWITDGNGTPTIGEPAVGGGTFRDLVAYDATQTRWEFVQRLPATAPPVAPEIAINANRVGYDPTASGMSAIEMQAAIDEISALGGGGGHGDGTNAPVGSAITGVDAAGNHQGEFDVATQPELDAHAVTGSAHHVPTVDTNTNAGTECIGSESLRGDGSCAIPAGGGFIPNDDPGVDHSGYVSGHGDGTNAAAGFAISGVDAAGNRQGDFDVATQPELDAHTAVGAAHHTPTVDTNAITICPLATDVLFGDGSCAAPGSGGGGATTSSAGVTSVTEPTDDFAVGGSSNVPGVLFYDEALEELNVGAVVARPDASLGGCLTLFESTTGGGFGASFCMPDGNTIPSDLSVDAIDAAGKWNSGSIAADMTRDSELTEKCVQGGITAPDNTDRITPGVPFAVTVTRLSCHASGATPSISLGLDECDSAGANCVNGGISVTCDGGIDADTTFTDAAFDASDAWQIDTGVASGTVDYVSWTICYSRAVVE